MAYPMSNEINFRELVDKNFPVVKGLPLPYQKATKYDQDYVGRSFAPEIPALLRGADLGRIQLAEVIFKILEQEPKQAHLFEDKDKAIFSISRILHAASDRLIQLAITRRLHHTLYDRTPSPGYPKLPSGLELPFNHTNTDKNLPVVYALIMCTIRGVTPTKRQFNHVLDMMLDYITDHVDSADKSRADATILKVHTVQPDDATRHWTPSRSVTHKKFTPIPKQTNFVHHFLLAFRQQLSAIPAGQDDEPLEFSPVYIGWTEESISRRVQHYTHEENSDVALLLEACFASAYPKQNFLLQFQPLSIVDLPEDATMAEAVWAVLASAYARHGGLCGAVAGDKELHERIMSENKKKVRRWKAASEALETQGLVEENLDKTAIVENRIDSFAASLPEYFTTLGENLRQEEKARSNLATSMKTFVEVAEEEQRLIDQVPMEKLEAKLEEVRDANKRMRALLHAMETIRKLRDGSN